jgi:predicted RNA binding protein YcfA (HicA-like mRNA interferase family)
MRWKGNTKTEVTSPVSAVAPDITEDLKTYFGKNVEQYLKSDGYNEIRQRRIDKEKQNTGVGDVQLEVVAKKQGFDGKPKVVSKEQMDKLEKQGWTIAYRGIQDIEQEGDLGILSGEELAEQFRTGEYFAGFGTSGNGIYFAKDEGVAQSYAGLKGGRSLIGTVVKVAIPPGVLMSEEDFKYELGKHRDLQRGTYYDGEWYGDDDIGRKMTAKGVRGVEVGLAIGDSFIIWDRSMLAVEESTKTK